MMRIRKTDKETAEEEERKKLNELTCDRLIKLCPLFQGPCKEKCVSFVKAGVQVLSNGSRRAYGPSCSNVLIAGYITVNLER